VQQALRRAFARWGRPGEVRVDNGYPWGSTGELPTDLALWLIGLGVAVHWDRPRRPQENGVVERGQGVGKGWAEPHTRASAAQLQRRLGRLDRVQREDYAVTGERSRMDLYPGLAHSGRPYSGRWERRHWGLGRVLEHLSGYAVPRRINPKGMVSVYDTSYYVSAARRGETAFVVVGPRRQEWVATDAGDRELRRWPAEQLSRAAICGLTFSRRRRGGGKTSGRH
jgi:hypothetical protein